MKRQLALVASRLPSSHRVSSRAWLSTSTPMTTGICPVLKEALPKLQARFDELVNRHEKNDGVFPILSPTLNENLRQKWNPDDHTKKAAVLIPLFSARGTPCVLFTARSQFVPLNAKQISFPGGHSQPQDGECLEATALRECREELLGDYPWEDPSQCVILGRGTSIPAINGTPVTPIIAVIMQELCQPLTRMFPGDQSEVEVVFGMPLQLLLDDEDEHILPDHRLLGDRRKGPRYPSPEGDIWGLTAFMLKPLLHRLYKPVFGLKRNKDFYAIKRK